MLNTSEANAAYKALAYPPVMARKDREKRDVLLAEYHEATRRITAEFHEWLTHEYAYNLPTAVQDKIWEMAWSDGHHAGYPEVENYYTQYAALAEFAINAAK